MYALAYRNQGIKPEKMKQIHPKFNMSILSTVVGYLISLFFIGIWMISFMTKFNYLLTIDELTIAFVYPVYIFIYLWIMKNARDLKFVSRFLLPGIAILSALFYAFVASGLFTLIVSYDVSRVISFAIFSGLVAVIMVIGLILYRQPKSL